MSKTVLDRLVNDHGRRWLPLLEELDQVRHSQDCVRASLPTNYDRGGDVMLMGACTCGLDAVVAHIVDAVSSQRNAIIVEIGDALAGSRADGGEVERLRAALETIRRDYGKVCPAYDLCTHLACESSVGAWMEADRALSAGAEETGRG